MDSRKTIIVRQVLKTSAATAMAVLGASGVQAQSTTPITGDLPAGAQPSSWDPYYRVCRGTDPACYHDWVGAARQNKVLLYTRTAGPRHASIGTALPAGLNPTLVANNVTQKSIITWLNAEGIAVDYTEDASILGSVNLNQYKAVLFVSNSRDNMQKHGTAKNTAVATDTSTSAYLDAAKVNLRQYIRAGGAFVAFHNAFGNEYNWPWYEGLLGSANYYDHGAYQAGNIVLMAASDPSTDGIIGNGGQTGAGTVIPFRDEWYNLQPYPTNVKFLAKVDDASLATKTGTHPGHTVHVVAWCQYYDGGRAWLTTLGHDVGEWTTGSGAPGQAQFQQMFVQGVKSAMGLIPFCTPDASASSKSAAR